MPWQEIKTVDLRMEFIELAASGALTFSELCRRFSISRKTGYKWLNRFQELGLPGLEDQSKEPAHQPRRTPDETVALILACRDQYPDWGGRKLRRVLQNQSHQGLPAPSTITEILRRHDRLNDADKLQANFIRFEHPYPNDLWQMDFKGHFQAGQGRCHPLTVLDDHSRFSLCLQACADETGITVKNALIRTFRHYGLPRRMTMDNGSPWGGGGSSRFSQLSVWLIEQGITVGYSRPYHPQTQGKDERFHRTLKAEVLGRRAFESIERCQDAFNKWRVTYNTIRPHESLAMDTPASRYEVSQRSYKENLPPYEYSDADQVRCVSRDQSASFQGYCVQIGLGFIGKEIAFRPTQTDGQYTLHFCHQQIGEVDLATMSKRIRQR
jgi:transposase InsO family protein